MKHLLGVLMLVGWITTGSARAVKGTNGETNHPPLECGQPIESWQLCIRTEKEKYILGEQIDLSVILKNAANEERRVNMLSGYGRLGFDIKTPDGSSPRKTQYGKDLIFKNVGFTSLTFKPGEQDLHEVVLSRCFEMSRAGTYSITVSRSDVSYPGWPESGKPITLKSNTIIITIEK